MPGADGPDPDDELGDALSAIEEYDGRVLHAHESVQDALDQIELLRSKIQGCDPRQRGRRAVGPVVAQVQLRTPAMTTVTFGDTYEVTEKSVRRPGSLHGGPMGT